jgi:fructose-1-phosphate kinase PfkB-like protein
MVCPLGGATGRWYEKMIQSHGIDCIKVAVTEETRTCIAVVGKAQVTEFTEPAPGLSSTEWQRIEDSLEASPLTIITGSFPRDSEEADIVHLLRRARELSDTLIVDTSGSALRQAIHLAHYISPNWAEACELAGSTDPSIVMGSVGQSRALISRGSQGVTLTGDEPVCARAPEQQGNPTGAGDALVAAFGWALVTGRADPLKYAVSVAAASVHSPVAGEVDLELAGDILDKVEEHPCDA